MIHVRRLDGSRKSQRQLSEFVCGHAVLI
jgi:hypothetical protein